MRASLRHPMWRLAAVVTSLLVALAACFAILTGTVWGRTQVCEWVNAGVSAAIAGTLVVTRIDVIDLPTVKAYGIRILDPSGVASIEVESAEIELDLLALLAGRFAWHRATVDQGTVRVTEDKLGANNMEATFRTTGETADDITGAVTEGTASTQGEGALDLRNTRTTNMTLLLGGGSLPNLRIVNIHGTMRIHVLASGKVELSFEEYRGSVVDGLPTGRLDFRDVVGYVQTDDPQLLHFEGPAKSEDEPVEFKLDILTEPRLRVKIDARFPEVSAESLSTMAIAGYTTFTKSLDLTVHHGR